MELFVVGGALITLDALVLARFGYDYVRGARRRAFLERRLGIVESEPQRSAPQPAVIVMTPAATVA
jgi:hypothetical protein